jgi:hypothetical protein
MASRLRKLSKLPERPYVKIKKLLRVITWGCNYVDHPSGSGFTFTLHIVHNAQRYRYSVQTTID